MTRRCPNEPRRLVSPGKCDPRPKKPEMSPGARALAGDHVKLAESLARPYRYARPEHGEDYSAAAALALCEAAVAWDRSVGVRFSAFARHRILGALRDEARAQARGGLAGDGEAPAVLPMRFPVADAVTDDFDPDSTPASAAAADADELPAGGDPFERLILGLPRRQRDVVRALYGDGLSYADAALRVGCSAFTIDRLRREALATLRAALAG